MMYFANDGGPLLLAPLSPEPFWEGVDIPSNGRVVSAEARIENVATDYDRACDVNAGAALLPAGSGWVIAINGEVASASWVSLGDDPDSFALVAVDGWAESPSMELVRATYESLSRGEWSDLAAGTFIEGGVELLHAGGIPGRENRFEFSGVGDEAPAVIGDSILFPCSSGKYAISFLEHVRRRTADQPGEYAVLVKFIQLGRGQERA